MRTFKNDKVYRLIVEYKVINTTLYKTFGPYDKIHTARGMKTRFDKKTYSSYHNDDIAKGYVDSWIEQATGWEKVE